jgi:hypothetical protein
VTVSALTQLQHVLVRRAQQRQQRDLEDRDGAAPEVSVGSRYHQGRAERIVSMKPLQGHQPAGQLSYATSVYPDFLAEHAVDRKQRSVKLEFDDRLVESVLGAVPDLKTFACPER